MATVAWTKGDIFRFKSGFGVILSETEAFIITGKGGRTGYQTAKSDIPDSALPCENSEMPGDVWFALESVRVALA